MKRPWSTVAVVVLALLATAHLLRVLLRADIVLAGLPVPLWMSPLASAGLLVVAVMAWRESRR